MGTTVISPDVSRDFGIRAYCAHVHPFSNLGGLSAFASLFPLREARLGGIKSVSKATHSANGRAGA